MTAMLSNNFLLLCILAVLEKHAKAGAERDEDGRRYLTQSQILEFVKADFGTNPTYRTIERNMRALLEASEMYPDLGVQLAYVATKRKASKAGAAKDDHVVYQGWRLEKDTGFETSEVRMLVDSVIASPMIPDHQRNELVGRLEELAPFDIAVPDIHRAGHSPVVNDQFFLDLEMLNEALERQKYVTFTLGRLDTDGELHETLPGLELRRYTVAPVQLLMSKGHCYFLAHFPGDEEIYKFRVELIMDVAITDDDVTSSDRASDVDLLTFREQHAYMMSGEVLPVKLRIELHTLVALFDQFGPNVHFSNKTAETVDVSLRSAKYSVLFWALQYYRYVEVLEPKTWREELEDAGRCIARMYEEEAGAVPAAARQYAG